MSYAASIGKPLATTIDFHPVRLDMPPDVPLDIYFQDTVIRCLSGWAARQKVKGRLMGWHAIATRENYEGPGREHLHLVMHCTDALMPKLRAMLDARFPGAGAVHVGALGHNGLTYRLKQSRGDAVGPPRPGRPRPETQSRHDGAPVAPVMGKRTFTSRTIDRTARLKSGWQQIRDEQRALAKVKRLQNQAKTCNS